MSGDVEQRIGTVDTWMLHHYRWPILRVFARHAVDQIELGHYVRSMLSTGRWDSVRIVPHHDADGHLSDHVYEMYGRPRRLVR